MQVGSPGSGVATGADGENMPPPSLDAWPMQAFHARLSALASVAFSPDRWEHGTGWVGMEGHRFAADPYSDILQNSWN